MPVIHRVEGLFRMLGERVKQIAWDTFYTERRRRVPLCLPVPQKTPQ